jgi:hypothetical protein
VPGPLGVSAHLPLGVGVDQDEIGVGTRLEGSLARQAQDASRFGDEPGDVAQVETATRQEQG